MMTVFDPVHYSIPENKFLLAHLGEPSIVALRDIKGVALPHPHPKDKNPIHYPDGVVPANVKPALDGIYELIELEKHQKQDWVGLEAVREAIATYVEQSEKWEAAKGRRGAPRFPTMHGFDARGRAFLSAVGSDSGQVRTYFNDKGERIPFALYLQTDEREAWKPDWIAQNKAVSVWRLVDNADQKRLECPCGHTERYKDGSRTSFSAARARMSKHMRSSTEEVDSHRALHTEEFS